MTTIVLVLTTVPVGDIGDRIASALVEERLAACVNLCAQMTSIYWWQGRLTRDVERQLVIKTTVDRVAAIKDRLMQLHPYALPELIVVPVIDGSDAYLDWIRTGTAAGPLED